MQQRKEGGTRNAARAASEGGDVAGMVQASYTPRKRVYYRKGADLLAFAHRLKSMRLRACLTQHQLAARAGVSRNTIARAELGMGDVYPSTVVKLTDALNARLGELGERPISAGWLNAGDRTEPEREAVAV